MPLERPPPKKKEREREKDALHARVEIKWFSPDSAPPIEIRWENGFWNPKGNFPKQHRTKCCKDPKKRRGCEICLMRIKGEQQCNLLLLSGNHLEILIWGILNVFCGITSESGKKCCFVLDILAIVPPLPPQNMTAEESTGTPPPPP